MTSQDTLDLARARFNMIEQQIRPWEVLDPVVLDLLDRLPREQFVPAGQQALAYVDMELPLASPAVEGECMLAPRVEARLLRRGAALWLGLVSAGLLLRAAQV